MGLSARIMGAGESTDRAGGGAIYMYMACLPHLCSFPIWIQMHLNKLPRSNVPVPQA